MTVSPLLFIALSVAGGVGAVARLLLDGLIRSRSSNALPWGTITINVSGSFALGLLTGLAGAAVLPSQWLLVAGSGFLGGYTTFSTASFEAVRLLQQGAGTSAVIAGLGQLVAAVLAAGVGLWIGAA